MRHGPTIYTTGRAGCWWTCTCGEKADDLRRTGRGASLSWALHVAAATRAEAELNAITTCGWCGKKPATGLASILGVRLCHGDDDPEPTCYQLQQWEMSATGSFLLQLHTTLNGDR